MTAQKKGGKEDRKNINVAIRKEQRRATRKRKIRRIGTAGIRKEMTREEE